MGFSIVSTAERPDLVPVTARWRWNAFFRASGRSFEDVLAAAQRTAVSAQPLPLTLVLLLDGCPVATASLAAHDLEERPDLGPWLAGVYVPPEARGRGYATRLISAIRQEAVVRGIATLWLYTSSAELLYAGLGWRRTETIQRGDRACVIMRLDLLAAAGCSA